MMTEKLMSFDEAVSQFDPVIGLEIHVELNTATKLFDWAHYEFGSEPNTELTPVSFGLPGALPVVNKEAVRKAVKLGLALNCHVNEWSQFARKNYFYPDMPRDYQISQFDKPTNGNGWLDVELEDGTIFRVPIERAHIEDDAGKINHIGGANGRLEGADYSLVDYNRAGVPLVEIVTKPITGAGALAPQVAGAYARAVRDITVACGVSEGKMEHGNLRADVNVSLRQNPDDPLGTRSETKNVNSFRAMEKTVAYEIRRQAYILSHGGQVLQETRHWDENGQCTAGARLKSDANDYRYFPDPDLLMLHVTESEVEEIRATLPELPFAKRRRLKAEWGLSDTEMRDLLNAEAVDLVEESVKKGSSPQGARKWWLGEILRLANEMQMPLGALAIEPEDVAKIEEMLSSGKLTDKMAKQVVEAVVNGEGRPEEIVEKKGLKIVSDSSQLSEAVKKALKENPDIAEKLRQGNMKPMGVIIGLVMKETHGQADAKSVKELIVQEVSK